MMYYINRDKYIYVRQSFIYSEDSISDTRDNSFALAILWEKIAKNFLKIIT